MIRTSLPNPQQRALKKLGAIPQNCRDLDELPATMQALVSKGFALATIPAATNQDKMTGVFYIAHRSAGV